MKNSCRVAFSKIKARLWVEENTMQQLQHGGKRVGLLDLSKSDSANRENIFPWPSLDHLNFTHLIFVRCNSSPC